MQRALHGFLAGTLLCLLPPCAGASDLDGAGIMQQVRDRHQQYPYVYEEQSLVLTDRDGERDTRKAVRYTRMNPDGSMQFLFLFVSPPEVRGVALLAERDAAGRIGKHVYLPALGERLLESGSLGAESSFLGTDFTVENLTGDAPGEFLYARGEDRDIEGVPYFTVAVFANDDDPRTGLMLRRHLVRQDSFFITRTEHFDDQGRIYKEQSWHDLKKVHGEMWQSDMVLMEDRKEQHETLIKIDRRVLSRDYVPEEVFTAQWLYSNYPKVETPQPEEAEISMHSATDETE